jgi:hypothetical protein
MSRTITEAEDWQPLAVHNKPNPGDRVLTWCKTDRVRENYIGTPTSGYSGQWGLSSRQHQPTHWMPLPAKPTLI